MHTSTMLSTNDAETYRSLRDTIVRADLPEIDVIPLPTHAQRVSSDL